MISYGGIELPVPTHEAVMHCLTHLSPRDTWAVNTDKIPFYGPGPVPEVYVGRLHWPTGAQRWSIGYYVASQTQTDAIRALAYAGEPGDQSLPLPLILNTGRGDVSADMFLLPPRPLAQIAEKNGLYLLTLVDERYFWQFKTPTNITGDVVHDWESVFGNIGLDLDVDIDVDTVPDTYGTASLKMQRNALGVTAFFDNAAGLIGCRVVRTLDGRVLVQRPEVAIAIEDDTAQNPADNPLTAGGELGTRA